MKNSKTLPRIYSISTVNVVMHYNQDYLVHPTRTDFTGENGAGKSIIADLLQLIFIHDPKLIKFGTEGRKNEEYYTLPKDANEAAFVFLNIEVFEDRFITIGVRIPFKKGKPIIPFVISKDPDLDKNIKDLLYRKDEWITSNHFIKNKKFLEIDKLSIHLRDTYRLYLKPFTRLSGREKYYAFLFEKEIIPINLARENNRKTFAKIIQSFAKAKALNIDNSDDLKQFIFEDSKQQYKGEFDRYKSNFEEQIQRHKENKKYVKDLTEKQAQLSELERKENHKKEKIRKWSEAEVRHHYHVKNETFTAFDKSKRELQSCLKRQNALEGEIKVVGKSLSKIEEVVNEFDTSVNNLKSYKGIYEKYDDSKQRKQRLIDTKPPDILEKIEKQINVDKFGIQEIEKRINEFKPIYKKYGSVKIIREKVREQKRIIEKRKLDLNSEIERIKTIIEIIDSNKVDTLFAKVLERGDAISEVQETVLFNLIDVNWDVPNEVRSGTRYTDTQDILSETNIRKDEQRQGVWLKTGHLHEFIPFRKERRLFDNADNIKQAISNERTKLQAKIKELERELTQIGSFEEGRATDKLSIDGCDLDEILYGHAVVNSFEETAAIIQNLNTKISGIDNELEKYEIELNQKRDNIRSDIDDDNLVMLLEKYEKELKDKRREKDKLISQEANVKADMKSLNESKIPDSRKKMQETETAYKIAEEKYIEKLTYFEKNFPKIAQNFDANPKISESQLDKYEDEKIKAENDYIIEYKTIVGHFKETKEQGSWEINQEIDDENYDFTILEKVLLGQIKHRDNIQDKLNSLNDEGLKIAKNICDIMLKVFKDTKDKYDEHRRIIYNLNTFFKHKDRRISKRYFLKINFSENEVHKISWLKKLHSEVANIFSDDKLFSGEISVEQYIEDFYSQVAGFEDEVHIGQLLDPQIYFDLEVQLADENGNETGSTGQTYAAIIMLCIARLSKVETGVTVI